jgi:cytochrome b
MTKQNVKVWDWPVRLFHWLLVATLVFLYVTGEILDDAMQWHFYAGYFCLGLVLFRILWGLFGTYYSRFSGFLETPKAVYQYLSGKSTKTYLGHNPAGGYSVVVMLTLILSQATSGLFISDEIFSDGPYYGLLSDVWQDIANFLHHNAYTAIMAVIVLHVGTIIYYKVKKKHALTKAMFTGYKESSASPKPAPSNLQFTIRLLLCLIIVGVFMYFVIEVWPPAPVDDFYF